MFRIKHIPYIIYLLIFVLADSISFGQNQTFYSSGSFTVPSGVTTIIVECWGGGGAGGGTTLNTSRGGGAGAGGSYAKKTLFVSPGEVYTVTVGATRAGAQSAGGIGNPSSLSMGATTYVFAEGGAGGAAPNGGTASGGIGSVASSIGDVVYPGGNGANGTATLSGGGGGGAGSTGAGGNASGITAGTGTTLNGGNGGTGRTTGGSGLAGSIYGGGGSGAYVNNNTNRSGGAGAAGLLVITWTSQSYTTTSTFIPPAGVSSVIVECWGGGGAGGGNTTTNDGAGGGGGGAYARTVVAVVPGTSYTVNIGTGGTGSTGIGGIGGDTWFINNTTILAKGGSGGNPPVAGLGGIGGPGGLAASCIGSVVFNGGNGGGGRDNNNGRGGPGGSSAGNASAGTSGAATYTTMTAGTPPPGGGRGGDGGNSGANGNPGSIPGGGGGGSGDGNRSGGNGANGQVIITWTPPAFYTQSSGDPVTLSNWQTSSGYSPNNFTDNNQSFSIRTGHTLTTSGSGWSVSGTGTAVQIENGGTLIENNNITLSANISFFIEDGGVLNHNVNSTTIFGGIESFSDASIVNYSFSGNQTVVDAVYGNLTLSGSGNKTISISTVNGIISLEGTASPVITTLNYGADAGIQYKGSSVQTTGSEFPATFLGTKGIIIDNANGIILSGNKTISGKLTFINGILSTGANTITLGSAAEVTGAGAGKYINGRLQKDIPAAADTVDFEIGDASYYTPVKMVISGTTGGTGNILAFTTAGDHPAVASSSINAGYSINRFWTITNNGVTGITSYKSDFTFNIADMDPDVFFGSLMTGEYSGGAWTYPAVDNRTSVSIRLSGLTSFGDFQAGMLSTGFRSIATGNWSQPSSWETFLGGSWIVSPVVPSVSSAAISVQSPHNISFDNPLTVDQLTVDAGASLVIGANMTVTDGAGTDMTINGTLDFTGTSIVSGLGSFLLNTGGTLILRSEDGISSSGGTGNIQTSSRIFSTGANYNYAGPASQITGNGLPATVNNMTVDNVSGVSLTNSLTLNGILSLSSGVFNIGGNTLTFQNNDTPVARTSGTITTTPLTNIVFGTPGNTGGAAFTLPAGTFTTPPVVNDLTINRINSLTLNEQLLSVGNIVLCNGPFNTNNNLLLLSDASQTALIDGSGTGTITGNVTMQRYLASGLGYRYLSSPFQSATISNFADEINLGAAFPPVYRYDETRTVSGWVNYSTGANIMNPVHGYSVNFGSNSAPVTVDITGVVNNGSLSRNVTNNNNLYTQGFNLVGNPYPSAIDWDAPLGWNKINVDDALYYFKPSTTEQYTGTYSTYVAGFSSDGIVSEIIPSMQGFFIHVTDGSYPVAGTIGMDNRVRVTNRTQIFSKSGEKADPSIIRLTAAFATDTTKKDYMLIRLDEKATDSFDSQLDALKLMNTNLGIPNLYALVTGNIKTSISAIPPLPEATIHIPLGLKANLEGTVVFKLKDIGGEFAGSKVALFDNITGVEQSLLNGGQYSILLPQAEYMNRFFLNISNIPTGNEEVETNEKPFKVWYSGGLFKVEVYDDGTFKREIIITSLSGSRAANFSVYEPGYYEFEAPEISGMYIVTFVTNKQRVSQKIIITK